MMIEYPKVGSVEVLRLREVSTGPLNDYWSVRRVELNGTYRYLGNHKNHGDRWRWTTYAWSQQFQSEDEARAAALWAVMEGS